MCKRLKVWHICFCFLTQGAHVPTYLDTCTPVFLRGDKFLFLSSCSSHPQLTPICARIDAGSHRRERSSCLRSAFSRPCADGRAECFDFLSFGAEIHEEDGVVHTCWNITQYQKTKIWLGIVLPATQHIRQCARAHWRRLKRPMCSCHTTFY